MSIKHFNKPQERSPIKKPALKLETTTLWDYPSQNYGPGRQGDTNYIGATPSYVIWNLLKRYTLPGDLIIDPFAGSGTSLDVAKDLGRKAIGYDLWLKHPGVIKADARHMPLAKEAADFIFMDPPYGDHVTYSGEPECIGQYAADDERYYASLAQVFKECQRVLKPERYLGLYICDSYRKGYPLRPIGFSVLELLMEHFTLVDIVSVVRHNATMNRHHYHESAIEGNYFLRGFNYLFIMYKPSKKDFRNGRVHFTERREETQNPTD